MRYANDRDVVHDPMDTLVVSLNSVCHTCEARLYSCLAWCRHSAAYSGSAPSVGIGMVSLTMLVCWFILEHICVWNTMILSARLHAKHVYQLMQSSRGVWCTWIYLYLQKQGKQTQVLMLQLRLIQNQALPSPTQSRAESQIGPANMRVNDQAYIRLPLCQAKSLKIYNNIYNKSIQVP